MPSAISNIVYMAVTDGQAPLFDRILDAVLARAALLNLTDIGGNVVMMKNTDRAYQQLPSVPAVVATYYREAEQWFGGDFRADEYGYPVLIQIVSSTLREEADRDGQRKELSWRQAVADAFLYQRLVGVPEVTTCLPESRPVAEPNDDGRASDLLRSSIMLRFVARKGRGAF